MISLRGVRWAVAAPSLNAAAWLLFWILRAPDTLWLEEQEEARKRGEFLLNSAAPWTTLAERPLNNWSHWHGGENLAVKLLEVPNIVPLLAAGLGVAVFTVPPFANQVTVYQASWIRGVLFLLLSTVQWWVVGRRLDLGRGVSSATSAA